MPKNLQITRKINQQTSNNHLFLIAHGIKQNAPADVIFTSYCIKNILFYAVQRIYCIKSEFTNKSHNTPVK